MSDLFGLSNVYIDDILRQKCKKYLGIFSSNTIPSSLKNVSGSLIVNLSPAHSWGSHFVTILLLADRVLYVDSLGKKCENPSILQFLISTDRPIFYQSSSMQRPDSSFCGFYCMLVVTHFEIFDKWSNPFQEENNNDVMCIFLLCHNLQKLKE